ncbi:unnamed protein product [Linum trigynum]|uniref:Uncharacterized protein n=1 Tax=Linum trigynum TaxID=586398 RepID=A0AAV2CPY3_9ROSI
MEVEHIKMLYTKSKGSSSNNPNHDRPKLQTTISILSITSEKPAARGFCDVISSLPSSGVRVVPPVVPESTAPDGVDDDEEDEEDDVDYGHTLPVALEVVEKTGLARVAVEAEYIRLVVPSGAVGV